MVVSVSKSIFRSTRCSELLSQQRQVIAFGSQGQTELEYKSRRISLLASTSQTNHPLPAQTSAPSTPTVATKMKPADTASLLLAILKTTTALPSRPQANPDPNAIIPSPNPHGLIPDTDSGPSAFSLSIEDPSTALAAANFDFSPPEFAFPLEHLFTSITSIPDTVLTQGDEALHSYLVSTGLRAPDDLTANLNNPNSDRPLLSLPPPSPSSAIPAASRASIWEILKCGAAIIELLATTAVPAAKILRIKKYIEALGGARQAAELLLKATTMEEKLRVGGQALVNLAKELLGISRVKEYCF